MSRGDFWSRRRAGVEAEVAAEDDARQRAEEEAQAAAVAEKSDDEILAEFDLPDPDTLEAGDEVSGFMQKAVPERLRQRALRRFWRLNPVLANVDGLNDYDGDFTNAATDAPGVKTAYRVGKGLLKHIEAMEAKVKAETEVLEDQAEATPPEPENDGALAAEQPTQKTQENKDDETGSTTMVAMADPPLDADTDGTPYAIVPRRMRFTFEDQT